MKTRFKGHETFFFREGWLSKALFEINANKNNKLFTENNGIIKLGVGANMVNSIKYWLLATKLLEYDKSVRTYKLTKELGEIIAHYDVYLEDIFSLWLIHINLVHNEDDATTWNIFFNHFNADSFSASDVKEFMKNYLNQQEIRFVDKSVESDINVLLNMYSKENDYSDPEENFSCPLNRLGLISKNRAAYAKTIPDLDSINELVVLYAIMLMCNGDVSNRHISISELETRENSLSKLFNFNRILINEYLDQLASHSYIRIEKTAGLDMVYITTKLTPSDLIKSYFEGKEKL